NAMITQPPGEQAGGCLVVENYRNDRRLRQPGVIAQRAQPAAQKVRVVLDLRYPLRFALQNRESLTDSRHRRRTQRRGKNEWGSPVLEINRKFLRYGRKATGGRNRFGQGTG